jgi:DNA (cytosine-5)-methyltransferase 1
MTKWKVFEAFAGYGGASFALKRTGIQHEIVGFSEIHNHVIQLYQLNHGMLRNFGDICRIDPRDLPKFNFFTGGFPCQAFSSNGLGRGELDTRGTLFYEILRITEECLPRHLLLENVKGLLSKRHRGTLQKIRDELIRLGYKVYIELLDSKDYGIPQRRERVWIFATRARVSSQWTLAPEKNRELPSLKTMLDKKIPESYYKSDDQIKRLEEVTGVKLNVKGPVCFDVYNRKIRDDDLCITILEPHHNNLRIIGQRSNKRPYVRKLTESEHFRLMGFREGEITLGDLSYQQLCRAAGNGWDVNLVEKLFRKIAEL